jgi:hypothetical protein
MMPLVVHDVSRCLCWPGYLGRLSLLHSVMTLAQQISSDIQTCSSHKYVAHQTALLYQCIGNTAAFPSVKKDIEEHFSAIKSDCSASPGHIPRLSPELQTWLVGVCHYLQSEAVSLSPAALNTLHHDIITPLHT